MPKNGAFLYSSLCLYFCVGALQGHPEARGDADGPPEEDHDKRPTDEGTGP